MATALGADSDLDVEDDEKLLRSQTFTRLSSPAEQAEYPLEERWNVLIFFAWRGSMKVRSPPNIQTHGWWYQKEGEKGKKGEKGG